MARRSLLLVVLALALAGGIAWIVALAARPAPTALDATQPAVAESAPAPPGAIALGDAGDVAAPDAGTAESSRAPSRPAVDASGASVLDGAIWVEGTVRFPPGVPGDERAFVLAQGKKLASATEHRFEIGADGSFRAAFGPDTKKGWLRVEGRYLYTDEALAIELAAPPAGIVLEARLGGCVQLVLAPSEMARARVAELAQAKAQAYGWIQNGLSHRRNGMADGEARIELGGLDPDRNWNASVTVEGFASAQVVGFPVERSRVTEVPVVLALGSRVAGVVRDEAGAPVDGAKIEYEIRTGHASTRVQGATTKDGGRFAFDGLGPGEVKLTASTAGAMPVDSEAFETSEGSVHADIAIVLAKGLSIAGTVRWADGAPAVKATVEVFVAPSDPQPRSEPTALTAHTSDAGAFELRGLPQGEFALSVRALRKLASADGKGAVEETGVARRPGVAAGSTGVDIRLERGSALRGRVVDDLGVGIRSFQVSAVPADGESEQARVSKKVADGDGFFELGGLYAGAWDVRAVADGVESDHVRVEVPADASRALALTIARRARVSGRVFDPSGAPRPGAKVVVHRPRGDGEWHESDRAEVRVGDDGTFLIARCPVGSVRLAASAKDAAESEIVTLDTAPGQSIEGVELRLRRGGSIAGIVRDDDGTPEPRVQVSVYTQTSIAGWSQTQTAPDGTFLIDHVTPGVVQVSAESSAPGWNPARSRHVNVKAGETAQVELGGRPTGAVRVSGTVRAGEPVANANVNFWPQGLEVESGERHAKTDREGRYEVALALPGKYWVSVAREGEDASVSRHVDISAGASTTLDIDLPTGRIAGRVIDARGKPVAGVRLMLMPHFQPDAPPAWTSNGSSVSRPDGRFEFRGVAAATYTISTQPEHGFGASATARRYAPASVGGIALAPGETREGIEIRLIDGGVVLARVSLPDGRPASGAVVAWLVDQGWREARADADGRARLEGLALGQVALVAHTETATVRDHALVDVRAGETVEVALDLVPGTVLLVRLENSAGQPFQNAVQHYARVFDARERPWDHQDWSASFAAGAHRFGPLPDGEYTVHVYFGQEPVKKQVRVAGGGEVSATVRKP